MINRGITFGILIGIYLFSWWIQSQLLLNWDVSWLLEASKRLISGGSYLNDFFENNPPMILYVYIPPVLITKYFSLNIVLSLRIYIILLATLSLCFCTALTKNIFANSHKQLTNIFLITLAILFLILPIHEFGQREHLLLMASLPYFLLVINRLEYHSINAKRAVAIGLFSGIGFALKPYFLFTLVFVEIYFCLRQKNVLAWIRAETISIFVIMFSYVMLIYLRHTDYLSIVMPIGVRWCLFNNLSSWKNLTSFPGFIFCLFPFLFYFTHYRMHLYKSFHTVLFLALLGFLCSYLIQHSLWYYRLLPAFSITLLILISYFILFSLQPEQTKRQYLSSGITLLIIFTYLYFYFFNIWTVIEFYPLSYFGFFACLFMLMILGVFFEKNISTVLKKTAALIVVLLSGYLFSSMVQRTEWFPHRFLLTNILLTACFGMFIPSKSNHKLHYIFAVCLGAVLFSLPFFIAYSNFMVGKLHRMAYVKLIDYVQTNALDKSIYSFSTNIAEVFPIINYTERTFSSSRFSHFWMIPGMIQQSYQVKDERFYQHMAADKNFLIHLISEDLNQKKPDLIFIDVRQRKKVFSWFDGNKKQEKIILFEYLDYFLQNVEFQQAWKHYRYLTTIESDTILPNLYKLQVYQRI